MRVLTSLLTLFVVLATLRAPAAQASRGFDPEQWNQLIAKVLKSGPPVERDRGFYITVTKMTPPKPAKSHHSEYFSTVGSFDGVTYTPQEVLQVSENWVLNKQGNWEIEQWFFDVSIAGELISENHLRLVKTPDSEILDDVIIPNGGVGDPQVLKVWTKILQQWSRDLAIPASNVATKP